MSKLDKHKTYIDLMKGLFYIFVSSVLGIIAYSFVHFDKLSFGKLIVLLISLIIFVYIVIIFLNYLIDKIKELEDM